MSTELTKAMTRDLTRYVLLGPQLWARIVVFGAFVIGSWWILGMVTEDPVYSAIAAVVGGAAGLLALILGQRRRVRRSFEIACPVGSRIAVQLRPHGIWQSDAQGESEVLFTAARDVAVAPSAVLLRLRAANIALAFPRELLTDEEIARLEAAVAAGG